MELLTFLGLALVSYVGFKFFKALGKELPILDLMLLIAGLQWIVGPFFEYSSDFHNIKYYMYVPQSVYMGYIVPAYAVFVACVILLKRNFKVYAPDILDFKKYSEYGVTILFIGVAFDLLGFVAPGAFGFLVFLMSGFKFVGAIILFFSDSRIHRYIFYGSVVFLIYVSLRKALFHDFILWSTFFYMFWAIKNRPSAKLKLATIIGGFATLTIIQAVKADYRMMLSEGFEGSVVDVFFGTVSQKYEAGFFEDEEETSYLNVRLNQGWIISAIMDHVPRNREFAKGKTIKEAIAASLMPRFLNPNKKEAGGQENFREYTGLDLSDSTSMGLSIIGEFYANFGVAFGVLLMGIWGMCLAMIWRRLISHTYKIPLLIFFLPLIFLQVVKAETELVVVLNHLVKSIIVVTLFFWLTRRYLKWQIFAVFGR